MTAQSVTKQIDNIEVSSSTAQYLGKSKAIRDLVSKPSTSKEKKQAVKRLKKVPDNFKGRKQGGKSVHPKLEHQGPDPIRQSYFNNKKTQNTSIEPLVNVQGITSGTAPNDPTGDVSDEHYVQAINATDVGVFDLEGNLVQQFAMNTLWSEFNGASVGDPIILYDERVEKWIVTEFSNPANLFVAISTTKDPLGSYSAYSFSTPNFPDYPKYAITPTALVVSTNEEGPGVLHQYFLDIEALYTGASNVRIIRVAVNGSLDTEAGFYLTTPVDWNGTNMPFDNRPMAIAINDSSWEGGPAQDQIELYTFNLDFDTPNNTTVEQTAIVTTPFDSYPCSAEGFGFSCVPQMNGEGLDAVPEVIMNIPHLRNFGTHESMVFNFVTDATNGQNVSGIRWVELRKTAETDWELYQEGTFSPDDGLHRFMGSIAMDDNGNIGMGYNVTSENSFAGVRFTGRYANDPLGQMTVEEVTVVEGQGAIDSDGRFGDYSQMSVSPLGDNTFWFTTEYAGSNQVETRITAFQLSRDSMDLAAEAIVAPVTSATLGADELVGVRFVNRGLVALGNYKIGFFLDDDFIESTTISTTLQPDAVFNYQFSTPIDLSAVGDYNIKAYIRHPEDSNSLNDTLSVIVSKLNAIDAGIETAVEERICGDEVPTQLTLSNFGGENINMATIDVIVNRTSVDVINYTGSIANNASDMIDYTIMNNLNIGTNTVEFVITSINNTTDNVSNNNSTSATFTVTDPNEFITLVFNLDEYPDEVAWTINEVSTGEEILIGSFEESQPSTLVAQDVCLSFDDCYTITVTDTEGDGICCGFGEGNFAILNPAGETLVSNDGDFGEEAVEEFCPSNTECMLTANFVTQDATGPNTNDGSIMIAATGGIAPYTYSIDGGATFQNSEIFDNLLPAQYEVVVLSSDGICTYSESVIINFSTGVHFINGKNVEVNILPNPTQGVFKIIIENLDINTPLLDVEVFDISGQLIQRRKIGKFNNEYIGTLSLYDYPDGNYFIRILNQEFNILEKIVKVD